MRVHVPQNDGFSERWSVTRDSFTPPDVPENLPAHQGLGEEYPYGSGVTDIVARGVVHELYKEIGTSGELGVRSEEGCVMAFFARNAYSRGETRFTAARPRRSSMFLQIHQTPCAQRERDLRSRANTIEGVVRYNVSPRSWTHAQSVGSMLR